MIKIISAIVGLGAFVLLALSLTVTALTLKKGQREI